MRNRAISLALPALVIALAATSSASVFADDDFDDNSIDPLRWGSAVQRGDVAGTFTEIRQRMEFTTPNRAIVQEVFTDLPYLYPLPVDQPWCVRIDATARPVDSTFIGLKVAKTGSSSEVAMWRHRWREVVNDIRADILITSPTGPGQIQFGPATGFGSIAETVSLALKYDPDMQLLSFHHANGSLVPKPGMLFAGSVDLNGSGAGSQGSVLWNLGAADTFTLSLTGWHPAGGDGSGIPAEFLYLDNFGANVFVLGDANGDGVLTNDDILPFVQALTDAVAYATAYPGVDPDCVLDMNDDGGFDNDDILGFVSALTGP